MDPEVVPGVLLVNRKPIAGEGHDLTDVTATILAHYGRGSRPGDGRRASFLRASRHAAR